MTNGHGLYCVECKNVDIQNSTFENLTSLDGGALHL